MMTMNQQFNQQRKAAMGLQEFDDDWRQETSSSWLVPLSSKGKDKPNDNDNDDDYLEEETTMTEKSYSSFGSNTTSAWTSNTATQTTKPAKGLAAIQAEQEEEKKRALLAEKRAQKTRGTKHPWVGRGGTTNNAWANRSPALKVAPPGPTGGKYIPPNQRQPTTATNVPPEQQENRTIRVYGLSKTITEMELAEVCKEMGRISRINVVKDRETKEPRGFAFVTFSQHVEAARAAEQLNGYRYDYRILQVDWARPRQQNPWDAPRFTSGYGKALPQTAVGGGYRRQKQPSGLSWR